MFVRHKLHGTACSCMPCGAHVHSMQVAGCSRHAPSQCVAMPLLARMHRSVHNRRSQPPYMCVPHADAMASIPEVALLAPSHVPAASVAYQQVTAARSALGMPPVDAVHLPHGVHARPAQHAPSQPGTGSVELETAAPAHVEWIKLPRILLPSGEQAGLQLESSSNSDNNGTGRSSVQGQGVPPLRFRRVAVGGTFDRLHAGHELLLAAAALIASEKVYVGITGVCGQNHCQRNMPIDCSMRCHASRAICLLLSWHGTVKS